MFLFRVIDRDGNQVFSRSAGFSGTYDSEESAKRGIIAFNSNPPYGVHGPFKIQQSSNLDWSDIDG